TNSRNNGDGIARGFEPKIADFGLAKRMDEQTLHPGTVTTLGTPSYMAPEQADSSAGPVGPACDVYGLGAILYDVLVGRPPFTAPSVWETLRQVQHDDPVPPRQIQPGVPRDLETVCLHCLRKDAGQRYASAADLAEDLRRFQNGEAIRARPAGGWERTVKWTRRYPAVAALLITILLAVLGTGSQWIRAESSHRKERSSHQRSKRLIYTQDIRLAQHDLYASHTESARQRLAGTRPDVRHWEWHYLNDRANLELCEFQLPTTMARTVALSSDGTRLAAGGGGVFGTNESSPVYVLDVSTGKKVHEFLGHPGSVMQVAFSPDGAYLASAGVFWGDPRTTGGLCVWQLADGKLLFSDQKINAYSVAFSPDGKALGVGLDSGAVRLYDVASGELERELLGHRSFVSGVTFRPDGKFLASASRDGTVRVWSRDPGAEHPRIVGLAELGDARRIDWSSNSQDLVVTAWGSSFRFLRQVDDTLVRERERIDRRGSYFARYSPDGQYLATVAFGEPVTLINVRTHNVEGFVRAHNGFATAVAFDGSGRILATAGGDSYVRVWDLADWMAPPKVSASPSADTVALCVHPTLPRVAVAKDFNSRRAAQVNGNPRIEIIDFESNTLLKSLKGHEDWLTSVAYHPEGKQIISGSKDRTVRVWDAEQGTIERTLSGHTDVVTGVAYVLGGTRIVSGSQDRTIRLWNAATGATERIWKPQDQEVVHIAGHGSTIAAATADGRIHFLDAATGKTLAARKHGKGAISVLRFSPDGTVLLAAKSDGTIDVWDASGRWERRMSKPRQVIQAHTEVVSSLAFHPQGLRFATSSRDMSVKLWDTELGHELLQLPTLSLSQAPQVCFDPEGRLLKSWDQNHDRGHVQWAIPPAEGPREASRDRVSDATWHAQQLERAARSRNRHAEIFHASRLMHLEPDNPKHYETRGKARTRLRQWELAAEDLERALDLLRNDRVENNVAPAVPDPRRRELDLRFALARVNLKLGRIVKYREHCRQAEHIERETRERRGPNGWVW
ncbi:MAG TPA: protein kinase, partial [Pirellulaceae bacterium]